jgi:NAD(P)-dependent dehydrogenase (short-subunit alcohol dehydrogenase family)
MNLGLDGKVALVTGGARDVGRSIALALAGEGAAVAVNYLKSDADAWALVEEIRQLGGSSDGLRRRTSTESGWRPTARRSFPHTRSGAWGSPTTSGRLWHFSPPITPGGSRAR